MYTVKKFGSYTVTCKRFNFEKAAIHKTYFLLLRSHFHHTTVTQSPNNLLRHLCTLHKLSHMGIIHFIPMLYEGHTSYPRTSDI